MNSSVRYIALKHGYYSQIFKVGRVLKTDDTEKNEIPFIFEVKTIRRQIYVRLESNGWEENFSLHKPIFYNHLFIETFVTE